jgi:hypothetical protein
MVVRAVLLVVSWTMRVSDLKSCDRNPTNFSQICLELSAIGLGVAGRRPSAGAAMIFAMNSATEGVQWSGTVGVR